jgi:very-short-patch-repair endonuclease
LEKLKQSLNNFQPPFMQDTIFARLESSRKELLDLGLRNPLLNYKTSKARGLHMIQEKSASIFEVLVNQGKAMTFLARPGKDDSEEVLDFPELSEEQLDDSYNDTRLQTNEFDIKLQTKILNTYHFARTSIEEQGVNILYIALGTLQWYEAGNIEDIRKAPLILIPVSLERSSAQERFRLKYTGSDIGANLSLQAKMLADFNISIPDIKELDDFKIEPYFDEIEKHVKHQGTWSIDRDNVDLGFFSFGKFLIYHDLDSSKWPEDNKPADHKILQSLFYEGFKEAQPSATEEHNLDDDTKADELFHVVDADSSQVLAMLAVQEGRNMVIQGPPGTGKSQTITNIIANAIGQGKKVLFVAEKMAALEVVKRRLDTIHLGEACLELHSHKANKKELHEELKRILDLGKPTLAHLQQEISLLDGYKEELNAYCKAINTLIAESGLSPNKIIGYLLQIAEITKDLKLPGIKITDFPTWNADKMHRAEATADKIQAKLKDTGVPDQLIFWGSELTVLLPHEENSVTDLLKSAKSASEDLKSKSEEVARHMEFLAPQQFSGVSEIISVLEAAAKSPDLKEINIPSQLWLLKEADIQELLETGARRSNIYKEYNNILMREAWQLDVLEIRQNLLSHGSKWYKFIIGDYNNSVKQLAAIAETKLPKEVEGKLKYVNAILEARRLDTALKEQESLALDLFGNKWNKSKSDWSSLAAVTTYVTDIHNEIRKKKVSADIISYLLNYDSPETPAHYAAVLKQLIGEQTSAFQSVKKRISLNEELRFKNTRFLTHSFDYQIALLESWIKHFPEIHQVIGWNHLAEAAEKEGFGCLIDASVGWPEASEYLKTALQKTWYEYLIEQAVTSSDPLRKFERAGHEETVDKFKKLDLLSLQYNRARVALKHWEGVPRQEAGGQVNILKSEFNRRARHMPIRKLVQEAGMAIQAIKPVFMMSPLSIANFLAPGNIEFDLVIFDEASQVRPVEALGAILRGKQLVVVGDTKQLPPTSFFDTMNKDIDEEENITADVQSILGMCDGQGAPQRMLCWHYRSRHESLISLSNHEFYENKLVIFPSPGSKYRMGLAFHHLPDAVYDRGKTRTNPKEAETVADAVIDHAMKYPKQTLGVVAFSTAQMQAIQLALEVRRRKHLETESFFKSHPHEPFFVKNLENVQGDERDVIFISIGYGRIEDGKVPMSFGPLNNEGGERRLNVLITRAKHRCEVFTNITSRDMDTSRSNRFGIRALKSFLYFAQHGKLDVAEEIKAPVDQPFEDVVAFQLEKLGYTVRKQVGSAGFYIDLAVVDSEHPGRYILGIQCDGDTYGNAKSARDRDRLRIQVLEGIGWKMYQVWSTDWFRNPERELRRLAAAIQKANELVAMDDIEEEELQKEISSMLREEVQEVSVLLPVYEFAELPSEIAQQELHLHSIGKLSGWLEDVVKVESPVHFDEASRRILKAAGLSQLGSRIRESLAHASRYAEQSGRIKIKGDFLWHHEMETPVIRERSNMPSGSKKLQYISPEEMCLAVKKVVESSIAIQAEAAVSFVAKMFGFARATEEMKKEILKAVDLSAEKGLVVKDGSLLKGIN